MPRSSSRARGAAALLACASLALTAPAAHATTSCASAGIAVTPLQTPVFYIDAAQAYLGSYVGYRIENTGPTSRADLWERLERFGGGDVLPATGSAATSALPVGDLAPGAGAPAYAYLKAAAETTTAQTHDVVVYAGRPGAGGTELCRAPQTITRVFDVIKAAANKVTGATVSAADVTLGGTFQLTVTGNTGTIGAGPTEDPGIVRFSPAVAAAWPSDAFRLIAVSHNLPFGGPAIGDLLARTAMSGPDTPYGITYTFRVVGPTSSATPLVPVQNIASGTQVKHTDPGTLSSLAPIPQVTSTTSAAVSTGASGPFAPGSTVPLQVTFTNTGAHPVSVDEVVFRVPSSWTALPGSADQDGTPLADPYDAGGGVLHLAGPFTIPAAGSSTFTVGAVAGTSGTFTGEGALVGGVVDATADPLDDAPARIALDVIGSTPPPAPPAPPDLTSSGTGTAAQAVTVAVPAGGTVTLLDENGAPATHVAVPGVGAYDLDAGTGVITFTPIDGYTGTPAGVAYRVTDAYGQSSDATYVPTVVDVATPAPSTPPADPVVPPADPAADPLPAPAAATADPLATASPDATVTSAPRACASRRVLRVHFKLDRGLRAVHIVVRQGDGRRQVLGGAARSARVDLRGLGRTRVPVTVTATLAGGGRATATRVYLPCRARVGHAPLATLHLIAR